MLVADGMGVRFRDPSDAGMDRKTGISPPPTSARSSAQGAAPVAPSAEPKSFAPASASLRPRPRPSRLPMRSDSRATKATASRDLHGQARGYAVHRSARSRTGLPGVGGAGNQLADANLIKVGQQLKLRPPPGWKSDTPDTDEVISRPALPSAPIEPRLLEPPPATAKTQPKGIKVPYAEEALRRATRRRSDVGANCRTQASGGRAQGVAAARAGRAEARIGSEERRSVERPWLVPAIKVEPVAVKPAAKLDEKLR